MHKQNLTSHSSACFTLHLYLLKSTVGMLEQQFESWLPPKQGYMVVMYKVPNDHKNFVNYSTFQHMRSNLVYLSPILAIPQLLTKCVTQFSTCSQRSGTHRLQESNTLPLFPLPNGRHCLTRVSQSIPFPTVRHAIMNFNISRKHFL